MEHQRWIKHSILCVAVATSIGLTACSGGSGDPTVSTPNTGVFLDSAVDGINYSTTTLSGTTNSNGEFQYNDGETVTLSIGDIDLPPATGGSVITPLDLVNTQNVNDTLVVNIARLLQSLDTDGDPTNGISISDMAHQSATGVTVDFSSPTFDNDVMNLVANSGSVTTTLIDEATAISHLQETLADSGLLTLIGSWYIEGDNKTIITFIDERKYFVTQNVNEALDPLSMDGMETGTYTWDSITSNFSLTNVIDTNGDSGLTSMQGETDSGSVSIAGNTLTLFDAEGDSLLVKVIDSGNPLIGSWYIAEGNKTVVTFIDDSQYFVTQEVEASELTAIPPSFHGMEYGTYTYNTNTSGIVFTNVIDTTGDSGFTSTQGNTWGDVGDEVTIEVGNGQLTFTYVSEGGGSFTLDAI